MAIEIPSTLSQLRSDLNLDADPQLAQLLVPAQQPLRGLRFFAERARLPDDSSAPGIAAASSSTSHALLPEVVRTQSPFSLHGGAGPPKLSRGDAGRISRVLQGRSSDSPVWDVGVLRRFRALQPTAATLTGAAAAACLHAGHVSCPPAALTAHAAAAVQQRHGDRHGDRERTATASASAPLLCVRLTLRCTTVFPSYSEAAAWAKRHPAPAPPYAPAAIARPLQLPPPAPATLADILGRRAIVSAVALAKRSRSSTGPGLAKSLLKGKAKVKDGKRSSSVPAAQVGAAAAPAIRFNAQTGAIIADGGGVGMAGAGAGVGAGLASQLLASLAQDALGAVDISTGDQDASSALDRTSASGSHHPSAAPSQLHASPAAIADASSALTGRGAVDAHTQRDLPAASSRRAMRLQRLRSRDGGLLQPQAASHVGAKRDRAQLLATDANADDMSGTHRSLMLGAALPDAESPSPAPNAAGAGAGSQQGGARVTFSFTASSRQREDQHAGLLLAPDSARSGASEGSASDVRSADGAGDAARVNRTAGSHASAASCLSKSSLSSDQRSRVLERVDLNQRLTIMAAECMAVTRGRLLPDPSQDAIVAVAYAIADEDVMDAAQAAATAAAASSGSMSSKTGGGPANKHAESSAAFARGLVTGVIVVDETLAPSTSKSASSTVAPSGGSTEPSAAPLASVTASAAARSLLGTGLALGLGDRASITAVPDEASLLLALIHLVRTWDADILAGYEVQRESWGYILDRGKALGMPLLSLLSRTPTGPPDQRQGADSYGETHDSGIWIVGRDVVNVWRVMRGELKLGVYSLESVAAAALRTRMPHFAPAVLTSWWFGPGGRPRPAPQQPAPATAAVVASAAGASAGAGGAPAPAPRPAPASATNMAAAGAASGTGRDGRETYMTHVINNPPLPLPPPQTGGASSSGAGTAAAPQITAMGAPAPGAGGGWRSFNAAGAGGGSSTAAVPLAAASPRCTRWRALSYLLSRAAATLHCLEALEVIARTSEMARLIGIDFYSVLSRGSQFKVEAVMARVARPLDLLLPSPTPAQVARQAALEVQPLILEPQSRVYACPVAVLDFASLYPSIAIAYNMCYSTLLGRLSPSADTMRPRIGFAAYAPPPGSLALSVTAPWEGVAIRRFEPRSHVAVRGTALATPHRPRSAYIAPNGVVFAPWTTRRGILPRMLADLLETRALVKSAMKRASVAGDPAMLRLFNARQHALKMVANTTYGYTAAGFSGRMPCVEIGDAIVQTARNTLERAIRLVEEHPRWRAHVVYGDTDSLFVALPGRSVAEALDVGAEIAGEVSSRNPRPMGLKLEKVYCPSVLVAKKRYAGFAYEPGSGSGPGGIGSPFLDCKGLEMVRRDTCGLVASTMEAVMRALMQPTAGALAAAAAAATASASAAAELGGDRAAVAAAAANAAAAASEAAVPASGSRLDAARLDLSAAKATLLRVCDAVLAGTAPLQAFIFAKEVRLGTYSSRGPPPPAAVVATKAMMADPRAEPRMGERVRFIVRYGEPGARLVDLVVQPLAWMQSMLPPGSASALALAAGAGSPAAALAAAEAAAATSHRINATYYLDKQVLPSLERILSLVGADVRAWVAESRRPAGGGAGTGASFGGGISRLRTELLPPPPMLPVLPVPLPVPFPLRPAPVQPGAAGAGAGRSTAGASAAARGSNAAAGGGGGVRWLSQATLSAYARETERRVAGSGPLAAATAGEGGEGGRSSVSGVGADAAGSVIPRAMPPLSGTSAAAPQPSLLGTGIQSGFGAGLASGLSGAAAAVAPPNRGGTIDAYYASCACDVCGAMSRTIFCDACAADRQRLQLVVTSKAHEAQRSRAQLLAICRACTGLNDVGPLGAPACDSLDCPIFFERVKAEASAAHASAVAAALDGLP